MSEDGLVGLVQQVLFRVCFKLCLLLINNWKSAQGVLFWKLPVSDFRPDLICSVQLDGVSKKDWVHVLRGAEQRDASGKLPGCCSISGGMTSIV